jgi:VWFA-related protein
VPDDRARIHTTVSLVVVPVTIKGRGNTLVTGLEKNDFRIFEDAYEQEISEFSVDPYPLSAAVLFDDDLKRSTEERVKDTLKTVAGGFSPADEVALWRFDEVPEQLSDFIVDNDDLLAQLKQVQLDNSFPGVGSVPMTGGPVVNTDPLPGPLQVPAMAAGHPNNKHINDAIFEAATQLRGRASDHRKIIFLISDGQNAKNNTHSYDQTLKLLLSSEISVYAVGVGEANLNHGVNILAKYAHSTGGDIFYASSRDDLETLYTRVTEQARNQYTLGYVPSQTDRAAPYHAIEVRVRRPGLSLNAREGYYPGGQQ